MPEPTLVWFDHHSGNSDRTPFEPGGDTDVKKGTGTTRRTLFGAVALSLLMVAPVGAQDGTQPGEYADPGSAARGERVRPIAVAPVKSVPTPRKKPGAPRQRPAADRRPRSTGAGARVRQGNNDSSNPAASTVAQTPVTNRSASLILAGDIAWCPDDEETGHDKTADLVERLSGTVMTLGDNAYMGGSIREFTQCYGPTWGRFLNRTRPIIGNHDGINRDFSGYYEYFGSRAGPPGRGYYTFRAGTWRVYALAGTFCSHAHLSPLGCGPGSPQYEWLKRSLANDSAECVLAVWHEPLHSNGDHGGEPAVFPLMKLLYDAGADVVVNGHDHNYERFAPMRPNGKPDDQFGIRQFVVGTGGAGLDTDHVGSGPLSEIYEGGTYGVLRLQLREGAYRWKFHPVAGQTFTDTGTGRCHGQP